MRKKRTNTVLMYKKVHISMTFTCPHFEFEVGEVPVTYREENSVFSAVTSRK